MPAIKISCRFCTLALIPFLCQSGTHCFGQHPDHDGKPYWYFWPPGHAPPCVLPPPMHLPSTNFTAATVSSEGTCTYPGCTKKTPTAVSKCEKSMCKTHCIDNGGCTTAFKHKPEHTSTWQKGCQSGGVPPPVISLYDVPTEPVLTSQVPIDPALLGADTPVECQTGASSSGSTHGKDDGNAQFARDMEAACQLSLEDAGPEWTVTTPATLRPQHLFSPSSSPPLSPYMALHTHLLLITSAGKGKGKG
ncbi:hypothetical protein PAXINDRAFT_151859 [Paxillus involutus ATCC 200175]|nr:hypothetical protein PAXINDRAFT_151859 [Paxillus involutus ATCC 200175]